MNPLIEIYTNSNYAMTIVLTMLLIAERYMRIARKQRCEPAADVDAT